MKWPDDFINKVICGDCLEILPMIPDGVVDLVVTDIPYNISQQSGGLRTLEYGTWDHQSGKEASWVTAMMRTVAQSMAVFCHKTQFSHIIKQLDDGGFSTRTLIWHKPNPTVLNCDKLYIEATELCAYGKRSGGTFNPTYRHNVFKFGTTTAKDRRHPTQKPVDLMRRLVVDCSKSDDIILDPFAGSGTTLVAAKQLGRKYIGIEISPEYCKIAEDRLRQEELF